jgi:hypothetical protein
MEYNRTGYDEHEPTEDCGSSESSQSSEDSMSSSISKGSAEVIQRGVRSPTSVEELQTYLHERCPEEFQALPDINTFIFQDWEKSVNATRRIRIGTTGTPFDTVRNTVYAYVHGDGNNQIRLTEGIHNKSLHPDKTFKIELDKPFWYLCWDGRLYDERDYNRLRALLCYLFIASGQVSTFKKYRAFEYHLAEACGWYGRALMIAAGGELVKESVLTPSVCASDGTSRPTPGQPEPVLRSSKNKKRKAGKQETERNSQCKMRAYTDFSKCDELTATQIQ